MLLICECGCDSNSKSRSATLETALWAGQIAAALKGEPDFRSKLETDFKNHAPLIITQVFTKNELMFQGQDLSKDTWGTPFRVNFVRKNNSVYVQVYSFGRDKIDNQGKADDIIYELGPVEFNLEAKEMSPRAN